MRTATTDFESTYGSLLKKLNKKMAAVYVLPGTASMEIFYLLHKDPTPAEAATLDEVSNLATARQPTKGFIFHTRVLNGRKVSSVIPDGAMAVWERR